MFLYCYIRKFKNVVTNNISRISKKDLLILLKKLWMSMIWILKTYL